VVREVVVDGADVAVVVVAVVVGDGGVIVVVVGVVVLGAASDVAAGIADFVVVVVALLEEPTLGIPATTAAVAADVTGGAVAAAPTLVVLVTLVVVVVILAVVVVVLLAGAIAAIVAVVAGKPSMAADEEVEAAEAVVLEAAAEEVVGVVVITILVVVETEGVLEPIVLEPMVALVLGILLALSVVAPVAAFVLAVASVGSFFTTTLLTPVTSLEVIALSLAFEVSVKAVDRGLTIATALALEMNEEVFAADALRLFDWALVSLTVTVLELSRAATPFPLSSRERDTLDFTSVNMVLATLAGASVSPDSNLSTSAREICLSDFGLAVAASMSFSSLTSTAGSTRVTSGFDVAFTSSARTLVVTPPAFFATKAGARTA
jgi:hypothetical protein